MTDREMCDKATETAISKTRESLRNAGIDECFVAKRLSEAMSATMIKVFNDQDDGIVYSEALTDHKTRLEATKFAATLLDMKPAEKHEINHSGSIMAAVAAHLSKGNADE